MTSHYKGVGIGRHFYGKRRGDVVDDGHGCVTLLMDDPKSWVTSAKFLEDTLRLSDWRKTSSGPHIMSLGISQARLGLVLS